MSDDKFHDMTGRSIYIKKEKRINAFCRNCKYVKECGQPENIKIMQCLRKESINTASNPAEYK